MYAHICSTHVATSRLRERGRRTHSAGGARAAVAVTTGGGSLSRRRRRGAATPPISAAPAARRMAVGRRTARASVPAAAGAPKGGQPPFVGCGSPLWPRPVWASGRRRERTAGRVGRWGDDGNVGISAVLRRDPDVDGVYRL